MCTALVYDLVSWCWTGQFILHRVLIFLANTQLLKFVWRYEQESNSYLNSNWSWCRFQTTWLLLNKETSDTLEWSMLAWCMMWQVAVVGGHTVVSSSGRSVRCKTLLHIHRHVVCWMHICRSQSLIYVVYTVKRKKHTKMFSVISSTKPSQFWLNLVHIVLNKFAIQ